MVSGTALSASRQSWCERELFQALALPPLPRPAEWTWAQPALYTGDLKPNGTQLRSLGPGQFHHHVSQAKTHRVPSIWEGRLTYTAGGVGLHSDQVGPTRRQSSRM